VVVVIAPDSGRAYLSKYFDDTWLRHLGFLTEPDARVPAPLVEELIPAPVPVLRVSWTVAQAREALIGVTGPAPIARDRDAGAAAPSEILGAARPADLARLRGDDLLRAHLGEEPPSVGAGEGLAAVLPGLPSGVEEVWVLRDGHVAGVVTTSAMRLALGV
jgi:cystathionine beta-synthase